MESSNNSNFHSFIFCQRGLFFTGRAYHYDLRARPRGQTGMEAHRELVDHLEGPRWGGRPSVPPTFTGRAVSLPEARNLMRSIPAEEQTHHIWLSEATGINPIGDPLRRINEVLLDFTGPSVSVSASSTTVPDPAAASSGATRVGRFCEPVIVPRHSTSQSSVHSVSSTSLVSSGSSTSVASRAASATSSNASRAASSTSNASRAASSSSIASRAPSARCAASSTSIVSGESIISVASRSASTTSMPTIFRHDITSDGEDSHSRWSDDDTDDEWHGYDNEDAAGDVNIDQFVYSSTSWLSVGSSRVGRGGDDVYRRSSRHSLVYTSSEISLPSLDPAPGYGTYPWDDVRPRPDDNLPHEVKHDANEIIQKWLASMEKRTPLCFNNANTNADDSEAVRMSRKRKAPTASESSTRTCEKPIAVVRPIMAAKRRRV